MFELHPQLVKDTIFIGEFKLSQLLIHRDANYPWFILVPKKPGITEIHELSNNEAIQLIKESCLLSEVMMRLFMPDKINIAALGNIVPQLHLHHIARYKIDVSWPKPVWGHKPQLEYEKEKLRLRIESISLALSQNGLNVA